MVNKLNKLRQVFSSSNQRTAAVKKNIIFSLLIKVISIGVSFLLVPMTLGYLNQELYGIWLIISQLVTWFQFLDIGFTNGLKNRLGEAIALNNWERGKILVSTTYGVLFSIFIPLSIIAVFIIPYINWGWCLNISETYNSEIIKAMYVLVACFCLQMILNALTAVIAAFQKVALSSFFIVAGNVISLIIIVFLTHYVEPSLMALALAISAIPSIILLIASFYLYSSQFKKVAPEVGLYDKSYVKDLFKLGSKFFLIQIQMLILYQTTNIVISNVSSPEDVTSYNIAYKYLGMVMMVFTILIQPLWPAFTDAYARKDYPWMKNIYKKMTRICILCIIAVVALIALSSTFYGLWIGDKAEVPFLMSLCVGIYIIVNMWDNLQVCLINGIGKIKLQTYVTLVGLICHIPLSLLLSDFFGAVGVIISMICITIFYLILFTIQVNRLLNRKEDGIWGK